MSQPHSGLRVLLVTLGLITLYACRPSTLTPPTETEARLIHDAVQAYIQSQPGGEATISVLDTERGVERNVRIDKIGQVTKLRMRSFRVSANGVDEDGRALSVAFFVLQTGPVFVVDTAVAATGGEFGLTP